VDEIFQIFLGWYLTGIDRMNRINTMTPEKEKEFRQDLQD